MRSQSTADSSARKLLDGRVRTTSHIPHNGQAERLNCRGHGTCGTCAVAVEGDLVVEKYPGFWGQQTEQPPVTDGN